MSPQKIIRGWKDEEFRQGLSEAERAQLPANPAGTVELTEAELADASGGVCLVSRHCTSPLSCSRTVYCY
jgi:mersacidin/lichenicidin family type 2 lantibiotic